MRWKAGDTVLNPASGYLFTAHLDPITREIEWLELNPSSAHSQPDPPRGAVLLVRWHDGKPLPVVDLGTGDLMAVETL